MESNVNDMLYYQVTKSNALIQKSRYNLTVQEQKLVAYIVAQIKPSDDDLTDYNLDVKQYAKLCGISPEPMYTELKETLDNLKSKEKDIHIITGKGKGVHTNWVTEWYYNDINGGLKVSVGKALKPYLIQLKQQFTSYGLLYVLGFKSKYSIRLYELLKSFQGLKQCGFTIDNLKNLLDVGTKYKPFKEFKRNVIDVAVREINTSSDLQINYKTHKTGRFITDITFYIEQAPRQRLLDIDTTGVKNLKAVNSMLKKELKNNG